MTPEKVIQNAVYSYFKDLEKKGLPAFIERRQAGGFSYKMGIPDLYAVYDGIHIEIEVKRPGGKLRTMQEKYRDKCERLHILWICVDNLEQMKAFMCKYFNIY